MDRGHIVLFPFKGLMPMVLKFWIRRLVQNCTETITQDSLLTGPRMHTKQPDVTICYALGLFRQITKLQLGQQFLQRLRLRVVNSTSACWFGRIRSMETGGWNSGRGFWWDIGRRSCSPIYKTMQQWCNSGERW